MRCAIYPGSFDPITNGHLDVISRASRLFDQLIVAVAVNDQKKTALFSFEERIDLIRQACGGLKNVAIVQLGGLLVNFARENGANAIVRGLRAVSDFEFEFQMALMNRKMEPGIETVFLMPREEYTYLSSSLIKEIARLGGKVNAFVPSCVAAALQEKFHCA